MMISKIHSSGNQYHEAYVWNWLLNETEPVVAGELETDNSNLLFNYAKSYLERVNHTKPAIPFYEPELPLLDGLSIPGCIRDGAPDVWGRRVIINKNLGMQDLTQRRLSLMN